MKPAAKRPDGAPHNQPWLPARYEPADVSAIQALVRGDADDGQQKRAIAYIINNLCGTYDVSFHPGGTDAQRNTDFSEGKRWIGLQLVKFTKLNISALTRKDND